MAEMKSLWLRDNHFNASLGRAHHFSRICPLKSKEMGNLWSDLENRVRGFTNTQYNTTGLKRG